MAGGREGGDGETGPIVMGIVRRYRAVLLIAAIIVVLVVANSLRARLPEVEVAQAHTGSLTLPLAASGLVEARSADLSFKETGRLVELYAEEGERVQQSQLLARIFPAPSPIPTGGDLADVIQAPWDGAVVVIYQRPGAVVNPGTPVLRLVESGAAWVTVFAESEDAVYLQRGQKLACRAGGYLSEPQTIVVQEVGREAVPRPDLPASSRQVRVRCQPADASFALPAGTEVDVDGEIPLLAKGLLIPANAVVRQGAKDSVWVVKPGGVVTEREVSIGRNNFDLIAITQGLQAGDTVVVGGKENLREGQRVRTKPSPPATPPAKGD